MYTSSIPRSCNDVNIAWVYTESNATHSGMLYYLIFKTHHIQTHC